MWLTIKTNISYYIFLLKWHSQSTQNVLNQYFFFYHLYSKLGSLPELGLSKIVTGVKFLSNASILLGSLYFANFRLPGLTCLSQVYQFTPITESPQIGTKPLECSFCLKMKLTMDYIGPQCSSAAIHFFILGVFET